ncbi:hypothetical protein TUM19329_09720 [Legionella antarctica]|uniref:Methyltransferase n=1 Tax=Legionella antarctica TaxID=2708020 RepID=A0A6F8T2B8_9GAMM|nr:hypothetical protein [Legionella antarctica]BCA94611.1 hypothetical protein TUM19329_09720 [Legionella antarctica]
MHADLHKDAIDFTLNRCSKISNKLIPLNMDIVRAVKLLSSKDPLHLVVTGGVFDYISNRIIAFIIKNCYEKLVTGGKFVFTNIAEPNPYRLGMELVFNWRLIMRSKELLESFCNVIDLPKESMSIKLDDSGLTYIVDLIKKPK